MCGITGVIDYRGRTNKISTLESMLGSISYRGPDESGIYHSEFATLGSVRLSIIDLQTGQQPLSDPSGRYWIVHNGEIFNFRELREKSEREERLRSLLKETELSMLRSQIRPHFLFNSLNSISSLTMTNPARAQEMVIKLSEFMRYSLSLSNAMMSSLEKDLYHAGLYLDIEKVRFGEKLVVEEDIDEKALKWQIPAMILQPVLRPLSLACRLRLFSTLPSIEQYVKLLCYFCHSFNPQYPLPTFGAFANLLSRPRYAIKVVPGS